MNPYPSSTLGLRRAGRWGLILTLWLGSVLAGLLSLWHYAYTPGRTASAPSELPGELNAEHGKPTLLVFIHPKCSCSQATVGELARIRAEGHELDIRAFFYVPAEKPESWAETERWSETQRIPGVHLQTDVGGRIARSFGASTSGQTVLYDQAGHLAFSGGITAFRGHFGDNDGHDAIAALLRARTPLRRETPVFGCGLEAKP